MEAKTKQYRIQVITETGESIYAWRNCLGEIRAMAISAREAGFSVDVKQGKGRKLVALNV